MEEYTEYTQLKKALNFLYEVGIINAPTLDYLQFINWVTYKKNNFECKELCFYNRKSDFVKFFKNYLDSEKELDDLINELESIHILNFYLAPSQYKRGKTRLALVLKPEHIFFIVEKYEEEQKESLLQIANDLQDSLNEAIINEDFEQAAKIRDEINKILNRD